MAETAGIKRKSGSRNAPPHASPVEKKQKLAKEGKPTKLKAEPVGADLDESDTTEDDDDFGGFSAADDAGVSLSDEDETATPQTKSGSALAGKGVKRQEDGKPSKTSAESHAEQRALAKERKMNKPNADNIQRSKAIWERLRRKSHVPKEERKTLVNELFSIISGQVRDFVFKHDSVRVIQCALKYANMEQRKEIATELRADIRALAESKYGKFLVAKMVVEGDKEIRDMIVPEFYGHVRRLINHPEAAWIVDDIYRQVASSAQKAVMLREWYGAEFAVFGKTKKQAEPQKSSSDEETTSDLTKILEVTPEKKKPIMQYLQQLINQLVQKKMTGFTMLHDAMLQYFLNTNPGSEEANEFLELLKSDLDEEAGGDLLKNLAFTKSGSKVVCLALAYGGAKDRKIIIRVYKDTVEMMAQDANAYLVLLAAMDVTDDTKMTAKSIFSELLGETIADVDERDERLANLATHLTARIPVLYPLAGQAKWLISDDTKALMTEVHRIRETTSKKNAETRRQELVSYVSPTLLALVQRRAADLTTSSFGCQLMTEVLLEGQADKSAAVKAIADVAAGSPKAEGHIAHDASAGRMLKTLIQGGRFDLKTKTITPVEPALGFADALYEVIKDHLLEWATGPSSFVVLSLLETKDFASSSQKEVVASLKKHKKALEKAANTPEQVNGDAAKKGKGQKSGNAGARILLQKL